MASNKFIVSDLDFDTIKLNLKAFSETFQLIFWSKFLALVLYCDQKSILTSKGGFCENIEKMDHIVEGKDTFNLLIKYKNDMNITQNTY